MYLDVWDYERWENSRLIVIVVMNNYAFSGDILITVLSFVPLINHTVEQFYAHFLLSCLMDVRSAILVNEREYLSVFQNVHRA